MHVRCPHCQNAIEIVGDSDITDVTCPSCGSAFNLVPKTEIYTPTTRSIGHFKLLEQLGSGGFGTVFKARDTKLDRLVAIKIPRRDQIDSGNIEMFLREARAAAQLRHSNIVAVHEVGRDDGTLYIVSDFIQGVTLADRLTAGPFTPREAAELLAQIAEALHHAHEAGVIHRDLKPQNIMLDADGRPHIMDFGLAKREVGEITMTVDGRILGTPAYMSPEQARGEGHSVDRRTDVYSLGVILFQSLTGELPFRGNRAMLLNQVLHDEPPSPRKLSSRVPRDLETITLKCMEKDTRRRYATAGEIGEELRRYLNSEPIQARPVGRIERAWRWCRRNPVVASLAATMAMLFISLCIVLSVAVWQTQKARSADSARSNQERQALLAEKALTQLHERRLLSVVKSTIGESELKDQDSFGLLSMLEARRFAEGNPDASRLYDLLWSGSHSAFDGQLLQMVGSGAAAKFIAFSPDGKRLLTADHSGRCQCWDVQTGVPVGEPLEHPTGISSVAFRADGQTPVTASDAKTKVWDPTGLETGKRFTHPTGRAFLSGDGQWLVVGGDGDKNVEIWDVGTGRRHGALPGAVLQLGAFSANGALLAIGTRHEGGSGNPTATVQLYSTESLKPLTAAILINGYLETLAFSPDGKRLATGTHYVHAAQIWSTTDGTPVTGLLQHDENVHAVAFSPDGSLLATASFDGTARIWEASSGQFKTQLTHDGPVNDLAFQPGEGRLLATCSHDATARLWDTATGRQIGWPLRHLGVVNTVAFSPDGERLATASGDGMTRIWDIVSHEPTVLPHSDRVWSVAVSQDGQWLAAACEDGTAKVWSAETWETQWEQKLSNMLLCLAFSPDGRFLAAGGGSDIRIYNASNGDVLRSLPGKFSATRALAFSPDAEGKWLVTGGHGQGGAQGGAGLFDAHNGQFLNVLFPHEMSLNALAISPDGKLLVTGCSDKNARLWDIATGKPHGPALKHEGSVEALAISPDGMLLATAARDLTIRFWKTTDGSPHGSAWRQKSMVQGMAFNLDGTLLATASTNGKARLWDVTTGLPCGPARSHERFATTVAFDPKGRWFATGSFDKTVRVWPLFAPTHDIREMQLRTWVALGAKRDAQGHDTPIGWQEWQKLRLELQEIEARK